MTNSHGSSSLREDTHPGTSESGSRPERGPVRILCDEIGFAFDRRLEHPDVLVAFVAALVSEVQQHHDMAVSIAPYTGKEPPSASVEVLALAQAMLAANDPVAAAEAVHNASHRLNPDEAYPTNHTIDMLASCASALRFGLAEKPWTSRHAAAAANHVWERVYGITRFDRHSPAWGKEWARTVLQDAVVGLASQTLRHRDDGACEVPPPGWYCTRLRGHGGPCAAIERATSASSVGISALRGNEPDTPPDTGTGTEGGR